VNSAKSRGSGRADLEKGVSDGMHVTADNSGTGEVDENG
jgi:hypothetical protein